MANIEKLTSEDCAQEIAELSARLRAIGDRVKAIRRPNAARPAPAGAASGGGGMRVPDDPLRGAGPVYRRIALEGSPAEMLELEQEREELEAERHQLAIRREALRGRQKRATEEERRAAAPGRLEALRAELPDQLDRAEAAIAEARAALADCGEWLRAVLSERKITGDDDPYLEPDQLRRLGIILRHRVAERTTWTTRRPGGREREAPALFASPAQLAKAERLLGDPNAEGLLDKIRGRLFGRDHDPRRDQLDQKVRRIRRGLLASGQLEKLDEAPKIAAASGRRGRVIV